MAKLQNLISELCPQGVPVKTLGELGSFYGGLSGKSKKDFEQGNAKYITYMNIYLNPEVDTSIDDLVRIAENERQNTVKYGDILFTGSSESKEECAIASVLTQEPSEPLYLNSFCFGFRLNNPAILLPNFAKHLFRSGMLRKKLQQTASGVTRFNVSKAKMANIVIPIPPIEIQSEIVRILDEYEENNKRLIENLNIELTTRKAQYDFYRNKLFSDEKNIYNSVELSTIAKFTYGYTDTAKEDGDTRFIRITDIDSYGNLKAEDAKFITLSSDSEKYLLASGDLVMARTGATFGKVLYFNELTPCVYASFLIKIAFPENLVNSKYYWHYTKSQLYWNQANRLVNKAGQQQFNTGAVGKVKIPLMSLEKQSEIVQVLDEMDVSYQELEKMILSEIKNRQNQYEYYRDKLLTFYEKKEG